VSSTFHELFVPGFLVGVISPGSHRHHHPAPAPTVIAVQAAEDR
jgi:hypothetical protein